MAGRRRTQPSEQQGALLVEDYRHAGATRPNNPPAPIAAEGRTPPAPRTSYAYSRRLDPALRADPSGRADALPPLLEKATREKLTAAWEQSAAFRLEQAAQQGLIRFYARNEGMDLSIPYELLGVDHGYEPDFLVRMSMPDVEPELSLVLEVKGFEDNHTTAKQEGARRWVRAVNNWGNLGRWAFHVCRNPQMLERELAYIAEHATEKAV